MTGVETLTSELSARLQSEDRVVVCVGSIPPGGLAHTRYLCKRLRATMPGVKIIVGRWGLTAGTAGNEEQLREAGADLFAATLGESLLQLENCRAMLAIAERSKAEVRGPVV